MNIFSRIVENISNTYSNNALTATVICSVLLMVFILAVYEFVVYRLVSHRAFYNKSFNICIAILPFFVATIIMSLQSSIVITLGTIGALAIIRFRTAVKDPVDMIYILWSIHTGIVCGCQLYELAVITSIVVTVVLIMLNHLNFGRRPYILVLHCTENAEQEIGEILKSCCKKYRIKSRNFTSKGIDFVVELSIKNPQDITESFTKLADVQNFSLIEYDSEDII